jgi:hypothetical protein
MYFEVKIRYNKSDDKGIRQVTELFVFEQPTFGAAEEAGFKHLDGVKGEISVLAVKRVEVDAIVHNEEEGFWHLCKAKYSDMDDKKQTYTALIEAKDVTVANKMFTNRLEESGIEQPETQSVILTRVVEVVESGI